MVCLGRLLVSDDIQNNNGRLHCLHWNGEHLVNFLQITAKFSGSEFVLQAGKNGKMAPADIAYITAFVIAFKHDIA